MAVHKHAIAHHWIKQTLVPFLLYAFAHKLSYSADISAHIQRSIDFCLQKADHPSDGDDLTFERIFMAIMHRHKNLAPDLEMVLDHLEPLAKYLIRRAQLKGPYELLEREDVGSAAWIAYEQQRLAKLISEPENIEQALVPPTQLPASPAKVPPSEDFIDPRLLYAQQGSFTAASLPVQLTTGEDSYYRRRNREFEDYNSRRQHPPAVPAYDSSPYYNTSGRVHINSPFAYGYNQQQESQPQPQQLPTAPYTMHQHAGRQALSNKHWLPQRQYPQRHLALPNPLPDNTFNQPSFTQQAIFQTQEALFQTAQPQPFSPPYAKQLPRQPTTSVRPQLKVYSPPPHLPSPQNTFRLSNYTPAPSKGFPDHIQPKLESNHFAHLRGAEWSLAAAQHAREIAANITARERDDLAQRIMQRQQAISLQLSGSGTKTDRSRVSPAASLFIGAPRSETVGMGGNGGVASGGASLPPAPPVWAGSGAGRGSETAMFVTMDGVGTGNSDGVRSGLSTLEQVRSLYYLGLPQQQSYNSVPAMAALRPQRQGGLGEQTVPGRVQGQQSSKLLMGGQTDAMAQLRNAAFERDVGADIEGDAKMGGV